MNFLSRALLANARRFDYVVSLLRSPRLRSEFRSLQFSHRGLQKLLDDYEFDSVLDIGSGAGHHSDLLARFGKNVTALDYGESIYFRDNRGTVATIVGDFNEHHFDQEFDCVWCSHVLEHQLDVQRFLGNVHAVLKEGGVLAITVPPLKEEIVGGHVSLWNGGLLLYRLVLAGFDCRDAAVLRYGYNITVIVRKHSVDVLGGIEYDSGDIRKLRPYLPASLPFKKGEVDDPFFGEIDRLNW